jgi:DNA-binding cell septation regulator SpoVG
MRFTVEKMFRLPDAGTLLAFADVCCDDVLTIRGVRVLKGKKGMFVSVPQEQGKNSKWYDQVVFKNADVYDAFAHTVISHYKGYAEGRNPL